MNNLFVTYKYMFDVVSKFTFVYRRILIKKKLEQAWFYYVIFSFFYFEK